MDPIMTQISENYKMLRVLGHGCYGQVIKCFKKDTRETVAVKVLKRRNTKHDKIREVIMLEKLKCLDVDMFNIIKCHESFHRFDRTFMVFEILDRSILDHINETKCALIPLNGIRTVIRDLAIAFLGLKGVGLIHTDLKLDNIMLVDHKRHPFRVKLIDFGLALEKSEVKPGIGVQPLPYRSPEVILGVPITEAIDIWSLGLVMAEMLLGFLFFPAQSEYDLLRFITNLLGPPNTNLLNRGKKTCRFYKEKKCYFYKGWKLKTPTEFRRETKIKPVETKRCRFSSLDELKSYKTTHKANSKAAAERSACVDLLKEMLQVDPTNRITPSQILAHPFITRRYLSTHNETAAVKTSTMDQTICNTKNNAETKADNRSSLKCEPSSRCPVISRHRVIMVQPAEKTMRCEEVTEQRGDMRNDMAPVETSVDQDICITKNHVENKANDRTSWPRVIMVQPAVKTMRREEVTEQRGDMSPQGMQLEMTSLEAFVDSDLLLKPASEIKPLHRDLVIESLSDSDIAESGMDCNIKGILLLPKDLLHAEEDADHEKEKKKKKGIRRKFLCCFCFREDNYVYDFKGN